MQNKHHAFTQVGYCEVCTLHFHLLEHAPYNVKCTLHRRGLHVRCGCKVDVVRYVVFTCKVRPLYGALNAVGFKLKRLTEIVRILFAVPFLKEVERVNDAVFVVECLFFAVECDANLQTLAQSRHDAAIVEYLVLCKNGIRHNRFVQRVLDDRARLHFGDCANRGNGVFHPLYFCFLAALGESLRVPLSVTESRSIELLRYRTNTRYAHAVLAARCSLVLFLCFEV